jgi:hypothetical protein
MRAPPELVAATPEPTTPAWELRESEGNENGRTMGASRGNWQCVNDLWGARP